MSDGINRVLLAGNLGADPDLRVLGNGTANLRLRLVTNERYRDRNEEWQEKAEWHNVVVWGGRAEALARLLTKGSPVTIEGSLHTREYEKDGQRRFVTEVKAQTIVLGSRPQGGGERRQPSRSERATEHQNDDIPF